MAQSIGIVGASGEGKTYSLRNLPPENTMIISPYKSDLPFRGAKKNYQKEKNLLIRPALKDIKPLLDWANGQEHIKFAVVEDYTHYLTQYILSQDFRGKANGSKTTWTRWEDLTFEAFESLFANVPLYRDDLWLIFIFHTKIVETPHGDVKGIVIPSGKMLEEKVNIQSYFTYMLYTEVYPFEKDATIEENANRFRFVVVNDGFNPSKLPPEIYSPETRDVNNDILDVIKKINAYNLGESLPEAQPSEQQQEQS